ncbi:MAG TPA: bifunctional serine/threonine-protein kinase/formylglycine-generating enzyme family protein [Planctomycetaceae bacterium]|jgi:serine/threonine protein kinase/formylglycine-generating enzyme required for sulfatase activity|nr:bifunctional serine/threonine-protein kinase/formylglycine-generating enzyme family protein [Planctomycetaceae bacterium]
MTTRSLDHLKGLTSQQRAEVEDRIEEFEQAWRRGERPPIAACLPDDSGARRALLVELVQIDCEFRARAGEYVHFQEYLKDFPEFAGEILKLGQHDISTSNGRLVADSTQGTSNDRLADGTSSPEASQRAPALGSTFRDYVLLEEIARGGMGIVYKARQIKANRTVALKMILAGQLASAEDVKRFEAEASAAATLDHPNIVPIFEVGDQEGRHFYSMGFVDGQSLSDVLRNGPLTPEHAAQLTRLVAQAIEYAHAHGIIHRDLKPQNILLSRDGSPRVADFGLAKQLSGTNELTATGQILGTPGYMSPEQARGDSHAIGPLSDIYSLGAVLYCLLTGRPPFQAANVIETLRQVVTEEPVSPRLLNVAVDRDLETITLKCLQKEPSKRYESAAAFADDLGRFLRHEPILARPVSMLERAWRWCRRNPVLASFVALLGIAAVGFAISTASILQAQRQRTFAQIDGLLNANPNAVPTILENLEPFHSTVARRLKEISQQELTDGQRWRLSLALLPSDPNQIDYLRDRLLESPPAEFEVIRDGLWDYRDKVADYFWAIAEDKGGSAERRFRAACALASFSPDDKRWGDIATFVSRHLVSLEASALVAFRRALAPSKKHLIEPLASIFRDTKQTEQSRSFATETLVDYAANDLDELLDLVADSEHFQFPILFRKLAEHGGKAIVLAQNELKRLPPTKATEDQKELFAKRHANAAVALFRLGKPDQVWPKLVASPDPRVRSYVIHWVSPLECDPHQIVQRLDSEPDLTIRRALMLMLGEFNESQLREVQRQPLTEKLLDLYENEPDAGLHAAAEWLLRKWGQEKRLTALLEKLKCDEKQLQSRKANEKRQWYVNAQKQTFVILKGGDFLMGSPESDPHHFSDESLHRVRIGRQFAISAHEVTKSEYAEFERSTNAAEQSEDNPRERARSARDPQGGVTWYEAAQYCNWLSQEEGIAKEEWCYKPNPDGRYAAGMKAQPDHTRLVGYRIPTEAEWEYACRAGTVTSRYYGMSDSLLPHYAWFQANSQNRIHPSGQLKPNDWGLFDMLGNALEWCFDEKADSPVGKNLVSDDYPSPQAIQDGDARILRGGRYWDLAESVRSPYREILKAIDANIPVGFRPVRTWR